MKKLMTGFVLAGLVLLPMLGMTADSTAPSAVELAKKAAADTKAAYDKGVATLASVQKAADLAAANVDKAKTDLELAKASGDKEKIKKAQAALLEAQLASRNAAQNLMQVTRLVDRLKVLSEKAQLDADKVAQAKTPEEAAKALKSVEMLARDAGRILGSIEQVLKPRPPMDVPGVTIPTTTTSTTQPSPTPVGELRG